MPTALRASRRCVSAAVIVIIAVVAAATAVLGAAAASLAAAAASLFASLHGGFEELVGVCSCRHVVAGRRADLFGGVGSFPGEGVVFAALQFLLEQELEVFSPQSWARPFWRRPRSRTPLHPSAEEPAPRTLQSGPIRGSALGSLR